MGAADVALVPSTGQTLVQPQTASGNAQLFMTPDAPVALYGKQLSVTGVEVCYDAASAHLIDDIAFERVSNSNGTLVPNIQVLDSTNRSDEACALLAIPTSTLTSESTIGLKLATAWTSATNLALGRVTWVLAPTATDATPLS